MISCNTRQQNKNPKLFHPLERKECGPKDPKPSDGLMIFHLCPKNVDLGGRLHPVVNNFPLSHVNFKVNFPLSNNPLALVSAKRQQQHHNTGLSLK